MELNVKYDFSLIGINTSINDYLMAFYLNKYLGTKFIRSSKDLDAKESDGDISYFSLFSHENNEKYEIWHLINNKYTTQKLLSEKNDSQKNLFSNLNQTSQINKYLIPEQKKANYILRLESSENERKMNKIKSSINSIPAVVTAFIIDYKNLKSKHNLIF